MAAEDEMVFVLLGRDAAAPAAIRAWIMERIRLGKNESGDAQLADAGRIADAMEASRFWRVADEQGWPPPEKPVELAGCVFGIFGEDGGGRIRPVLLTVSGVECLAVFSTKEKMDEAYKQAGVIAIAKVKKIDGGRGFLESLPPDMPVILDPWLTDRGTTRFQLVRGRGAFGESQ
jgi:hypothetical protein